MATSTLSLTSLSLSESTIFSHLRASKHSISPLRSVSLKSINKKNLPFLSFSASLNRKTLSFSPLVARTSDWAQQDEEEKELDSETDFLDGEEGEEGNFTWEGDEGESEGLGEPEGESGDGFVGEESGDAAGDAYPEPPEEAKLFVGNIPYDMTSEKLAEFFDGAGIVEIAEIIYNRGTDQSRGFGFVTMSTVEEAEKAIEMFNSYEIDGRILTVNKAAPRGSRLERAPREPRSAGFTVYVGNLPWQVDGPRLEQVFSEHGKVVSARVMYDRESGRSRGFGFVTMETKEELDDAIAALDGQSLDGRALRVNVAENRPRRTF